MIAAIAVWRTEPEPEPEPLPPDREPGQDDDLPF